MKYFFKLSTEGIEGLEVTRLVSEVLALQYDFDSFDMACCSPFVDSIKSEQDIYDRVKPEREAFEERICRLLAWLTQPATEG